MVQNSSPTAVGRRSAKGERLRRITLGPWRTVRQDRRYYQRSLQPHLPRHGDHGPWLRL